MNEQLGALVDGDLSTTLNGVGLGGMNRGGSFPSSGLYSPAVGMRDDMLIWHVALPTQFSPEQVGASTPL